jgi:molybdate/tungstate transport system substrate-binding protein
MRQLKILLRYSFLSVIFFGGIFLGYKAPLFAQGHSNSNKQVIIFYAAGLNASLDGVFKEFKKLNPSTEIIGESSGTLLAIRKITELNKRADIILAADALAIQDMLVPKYADWYINFYKDRVVLAYTSRSKYTNEINAKNWYKVLTRPDVRFGYANPNLAPIGYRTLMVWQLADLYYKDKVKEINIYEALKEACPAENIMPDVAEMLHLLESLSLDYAFIYESTAKQHNLKYIQLPKEIDLGSIELSDIYKQAKVEITSSKKGKKELIIGSSITFALTILKDSPNFKAAIEFIKLFLGPQGQRIMSSNDQDMLVPCNAYNPDNVPEELKQFCIQEGRNR